MTEISYTKTVWVNNVTPLNADNMNHIENGIEALATELEKKIEKPEVSPTVGTVLKVTAVNDDGTFTCAWAEESGGVDVQIAGTSIVQDGVANIPYASSEQAGIVQVQNKYGIDVNSTNGLIFLYPTNDTEISARSTTNRRAICISNLDYAVKAAMCDGKGAAWTDTEKAAARLRMGVTNGSTGDSFSFELYPIPDGVEQLYTSGDKTLFRTTKENFLTFAYGCTDETYERMLQGALVTQNAGSGAAVSSTLITYPPRYVGVGIRLNPGYNASVLFGVMGDRRIAFFPNFETGHESDIYFMFNGSANSMIDIIAY